MTTISDLGIPLPTQSIEPVAVATPQRSAASTAKQTRPFRTGFCGPSDGDCRDRGNHCPGAIQNGVLAAEPVKNCTCTCHSAN
jgi:hypothetical protein